jgi:hypothetical protein
MKNRKATWSDVAYAYYITSVTVAILTTCKTLRFTDDDAYQIQLKFILQQRHKRKNKANGTL